MTLQRRRGARIRIVGVKETVDNRRNKAMGPDPDNYVDTRASVIWDRSNRAEVPGDQWVQVYRVIINRSLDLTQVWGLIWWDGSWWDIINPPEKHVTGRPHHQRNIVALIRERPPGSTPLDPPDWWEG